MDSYDLARHQGSKVDMFKKMKSEEAEDFRVCDRMDHMFIMFMVHQVRQVLLIFCLETSFCC